MKLYEGRTPDGPNGWVLTERDAPTPKANEVLIAVKAVSLNYRDLLLSKNPNAKRPIAPLSDGAGEIIAVGGGRDAIFGWRPDRAEFLPGLDCRGHSRRLSRLRVWRRD